MTDRDHTLFLVTTLITARREMFAWLRWQRRTARFAHLIAQARVQA